MTKGGEALDAVGRFVEAMTALRRERGWSQERLSQELAAIGAPISPSSITKIEWLLDEERSLTARPIRLHEAVAIASVFETDVALMMHGTPLTYLPKDAVQKAREEYAEALRVETELKELLVVAESKSELLRDRVHFILTEFVGEEVGGGEHPEEA